MSSSLQLFIIWLLSAAKTDAMCCKNRPPQELNFLLNSIWLTALPPINHFHWSSAVFQHSSRILI